MFAYGFSISLMFFGVFCALTGALIVKSKFIWADSFRLFLQWSDFNVPLASGGAELLLMLWLLVFGLNEQKWRARAEEVVAA